MLGKVNCFIILLSITFTIVFLSDVSYSASNSAIHCDSEICMSVKKPKGWTEFRGGSGFTFFYEKTGTSNSFELENNNNLSNSEFRRQILASVKKYFEGTEFEFDKKNDTYTIEKGANFSVVSFFKNSNRAFIYESKTNKDLPSEEQLAKDKKFTDGMKAVRSLNFYKKTQSVTQSQNPRQTNPQQQNSRQLNPMEQLIAGTLTEALTGQSPTGAISMFVCSKCAATGQSQSFAQNPPSNGCRSGYHSWHWVCEKGPQRKVCQNCGAVVFSDPYKYPESKGCGGRSGLHQWVNR